MIKLIQKDVTWLVPKNLSKRDPHCFCLRYVINHQPPFPYNKFHQLLELRRILFFFFNTKSSVSQNNAQGLFIGVWMWEDQFVTFAWDSSSKRTVKLRQFFHYCDFHISSHILHLNVREVLARKATCRFPKPFSVSALSPNFDSSNAAIAIFTSWILFALDLPRHISTQSHISKLHL